MKVEMEDGGVSNLPKNTEPTANGVGLPMVLQLVSSGSGFKPGQSGSTVRLWTALVLRKFLNSWLSYLTIH